MNHAVILAVGNPYNSQLVYNRSHAMLSALGKPIFVRIMERLYRIGLRDYTVVVGEAEGAVTSYLNSQWMPDVKINWVFRLGTESLVKIMQSIAQSLDAPFLVTSYNSFTHTHFPERLIRKHQESPADLIFSGAPHTLSQASNLVYAVMQDKHLVDLSTTATPGAYVLNDLFICGNEVVHFLQNIPAPAPSMARTAQFMDIAYLYLQAGNSGLLAESNWILQVEADRDLLTLTKLLLDEGQDAHILSELPYTVKITPPVRIDPQVSIGQGAMIGPHVYIERGASVGHNAVIKNSLILARANVPAERTIVNTILTTRGPIN